MSQIKTKFIEDNAVNDAKARLRNAQSLRSRNAANSGDVSLIRANAGDVIEIPGALSMAGFTINSLADPTLAQQAATKAYVDAAAVGIAWKYPVRATTTAVLPANTYVNGTAGVGATLTGNVNGAITAQDGVTLVAADRLLVKNEAAAANNGLYAVTVVGTGGTPYVLTRVTDADTATELPGAAVFVLEGTINADNGFVCSTTGAITVGTTALTFVQFSGAGEIIAGNGITKSNNTISTNNGAGLTYLANQNIVATQAAGLDQTTGLDGSNNIKALKGKKEIFTLGAGDITNQYVDLANVANRDSIQVIPDGGPHQREATDYTLNYTGGAGSKTRVSFAGDLATGGAAALVATDVLRVNYTTM